MITAQKNLPRAPHTHPPGMAGHMTGSGPTPFVPWKLSAGVWHGRWPLLLRARMWCVASPGQLQAWQRLRVGLRFVLRGSVLSDSGDLSALPTPLLCPLLNSASGGCAWSGREGVPPPSQGSLNSLHPASLHPVPPLHPSMPKLGWPVSSCSQAAGGGGRGAGCAQAPGRPPAQAVSASGRALAF